MAGSARLRCRLPQLCRALSPALPAAPRRRSAPWLVRCWLCSRPLRAARSGGCVADAVKSLGQDVKQEAPDELVGSKGHCAISRLPVAAIVLVAEGDAALVEGKQAAVCDGDAVGIAGEIGEHRLGPGKGRLGIDEPVLPPQRRKVRGEGWAMAQALDLAEEHQPARGWGVGG